MSAFGAEEEQDEMSAAKPAAAIIPVFFIVVYYELNKILKYFNEFHIENQCAVRRDGISCAACTVAQ